MDNDVIKKTTPITRAKQILKLLLSFPLLLTAGFFFKNVFIIGTNEPILETIWGAFFLVTGSTLLLDSLGSSFSNIYIQIKTSGAYKKIYKIASLALKVLLIFSIIFVAFNILAGIGATTIIIILLILIYFKIR